VVAALRDGGQVRGRLVGADDDGIELHDGRRVSWAAASDSYSPSLVSAAPSISARRRPISSMLAAWTAARARSSAASRRPASARLASSTASASWWAAR
jgi:hypothetical protein